MDTDGKKKVGVRKRTSDRSMSLQHSSHMSRIIILYIYTHILILILLHQRKTTKLILLVKTFIPFGKYYGQPRRRHPRPSLMPPLHDRRDDSAYVLPSPSTCALFLSISLFNINSIDSKIRILPPSF